MQICGKSVDLEEIKTAQAELEALMSDPALIADMEAKVAEINTKLNDFKPEIPELPNLQQALSDLGSITDSEEYQAAVKQLKQDFGTVVDNLNEIIEEVNPRINELLNDLPDSETLLAVADGSLVGEALTKALQEIAVAEAKLAQKLSIQGLPTVDSTVVCNQVPNIDVETITETVTVAGVSRQVETKRKVELPKEPIVPKAVPVKSEPKPVQKTAAIDTVDSSRKALLSAQGEAINVIRAQITRKYYPPDGDWRSAKASLSEAEYQEKVVLVREETLAYVFWYQYELLKILGETDINQRGRLYPAAFKVTLEKAQSLIPESKRLDLFNEVKRLYNTANISEIVKFENAVPNHYRLRNAQGGLA